DLCFQPVMRAYFGQPRHFLGAGITRTDLLADSEWFSSPYHENVHDPLGAGHHLIAFHPVPGGAGELVGFNVVRVRSETEECLGRVRVLVAEALAVVAPLVGGPVARFGEPSPAELAPRVRQVLRCLLEGDADKQVARRLGISPYTVNQYTKVIYQHFGVA